MVVSGNIPSFGVSTKGLAWDITAGGRKKSSNDTDGIRNKLKEERLSRFWDTMDAELSKQATVDEYHEAMVALPTVRNDIPSVRTLSLMQVIFWQSLDFKSLHRYEGINQGTPNFDKRPKAKPVNVFNFAFLHDGA